jgi:DNA invertase Pin-like site-specific DNA recombinase
VREEKKSGTTRNGRTELETLLAFMREGDVLMVTRIDTSTAAGKAFFDMLGVFAEFETNLRRERQLEGVKKAKKEGKYKGTAPKIDRAAITRLRSEGKNVTQIG